MLKTVVTSSICGLLSSFVFIAAYNYFYYQRIAVVKMDEVLSHHLAAIGGKEMSEDQKKEEAELFNRKLEKVVRDLSIRDKVTLLVSPAVVSGLPDYTEIIKKKVSE